MSKKGANFAFDKWERPFTEALSRVEPRPIKTGELCELIQKLGYTITDTTVRKVGMQLAKDDRSEVVFLGYVDFRAPEDTGFRMPALAFGLREWKLPINEEVPPAVQRAIRSQKARAKRLRQQQETREARKRENGTTLQNRMQPRRKEQSIEVEIGVNYRCVGVELGDRDEVIYLFEHNGQRLKMVRS